MDSDNEDDETKFVDDDDEDEVTTSNQQMRNGDDDDEEDELDKFMAGIEVDQSTKYKYTKGGGHRMFWVGMRVGQVPVINPNWINWNLKAACNTVLIKRAWDNLVLQYF